MSTPPPRVPLGRVGLVFLRLGAIGFGGPAAHIALMQEELVERRGWLSRESFAAVLGVTNLIPGPNSSEVAIHTGYVVAGPVGGVVASVSFVLPAAHIALMQEELVERRGWLSRESFAAVLGVTNLIPGPNSSEVAIHTGYVVAGPVGGVVASVSFVLPAAHIALMQEELVERRGWLSRRASPRCWG